MTTLDYAMAAETIRNDLRLRSLPVAASFLVDPAGFPEKTRRPSLFFQKRITICQAVTLARIYGWTMGLTREDLICVPGMLLFGFTPAVDQPAALARLFCEVGFAQEPGKAEQEASSLLRLAPGEYPALVLQPLSKVSATPDTICLYGNPAQIMRLAQAYAFATGERVLGEFGGKVGCEEYLLAPFKLGRARVAIPGMGDRIFSMTQDDELVFALPGGLLPDLLIGLQAAGKNIGARYPITFYQNFQPEFPKYYQELGRELELF